MCGIISIFNRNANNKITVDIQDSLTKLQNRGHDSYGYYLNYKNDTKKINNLGLIKRFKTKESYKVAIGHTRYATSYQKTTKQDINCIQPLTGKHKHIGEFILVHNGNISNLDKLREDFGIINNEFLNDSKMLVKIIENSSEHDLSKILINILEKITGIFNLIVYHKNKDTLYCL